MRQPWKRFHLHQRRAGLKAWVAIWVLGLCGFQAQGTESPLVLQSTFAEDPNLPEFWRARAESLCAQHPGKSGAITLERGEIALLTRGWLVENARKTLDVQYFIWNADNVGRLAMDAFLRAADRGVRVRILVDDFMLETPQEWLSTLDAHPGIAIKVYNPTTRTGVSTWRKWWNMLTRFRGVNQRMHNKVVIADEFIAVTGGRNLADEYFDFHHEFNFRDRDVLLMGEVISPMDEAFEAYWESPLAQRYQSLVPPVAKSSRDSIEQDIRRYALDTANFSPAIRSSMENLHRGFDKVFRDWVWAPMRFVTDVPGKNPGTHGWLGLRGGGVTTEFLASLIDSAKVSVTMQTPYLVPDDSALALLHRKVEQGLPVRISTNSLANNDNVQAMSGYLLRRKAILKSGVNVFEYKPFPVDARELIPRQALKEGAKPIFVIHAKTVVIDHAKVFIGTFNFDPRSMNLNTESGVLIEDEGLAREVEAAIEQSMRPENSWPAESQAGDKAVSIWVRFKTWLWGLLPIESLV